MLRIWIKQKHSIYCIIAVERLNREIDHVFFFIENTLIFHYISLIFIFLTLSFFSFSCPSILETPLFLFQEVAVNFPSHSPGSFSP